jgi:hypothetical protein
MCICRRSDAGADACTSGLLRPDMADVPAGGEEADWVSYHEDGQAVSLDA